MDVKVLNYTSSDAPDVLRNTRHIPVRDKRMLSERRWKTADGEARGTRGVNVLAAVGHLAGFRDLQRGVFLSFKHPSTSEERWWPFFVLGHLVAMASNVFLTGLYRRMNPNVALGVGLGGAFLTGQLALAWVYHSRLSVIQWIAIGLLTMGLLLLAGGKGAEV